MFLLLEFSFNDCSPTIEAFESAEQDSRSSVTTSEPFAALPLDVRKASGLPGAGFD
jgi:hypothetical protein